MSLGAALIGPGRMGNEVADVWRERGHRVVARIGRGDDLAAATGADVAFELTTPDAASGNVGALLALGVPTVCGTTGWDPTEARRLATEAAVPLLVAPNFSIGVAVLRAAVAEAARRLAGDSGFAAGIVERHHAGKRDSPSGTAKMLAATVGELLGEPPPVVALRHGGQPGEHRVIFEGPEETVELVHRARSRRAFALGAVLAAEWLARERPAGAVTFEDFLERSRR